MTTPRDRPPSATSPSAASRLAANTAARVAPLVASLDLTEGALALLEPEMTPRQFINALAEKELYGDAVKTMAAALDKTAAVRWAMACAQADGAESKVKSDAVCRTAVEAWLAEPSDKNRRLAMTVSESSGMTTAYHWIAAAAAWSGGSLAPAEFDAVQPPTHLTAAAIACAIRLTALKQPAEFATRLFAFLKLGARFAVSDGERRA